MVVSGRKAVEFASHRNYITVSGNILCMCVWIFLLLCPFDFSQAKVIVVGLPKTGTESLAVYSIQTLPIF